MMAEETKVVVTFTYYPDDPDPDDSTGMSEQEFENLYAKLMALGADEMEVEKVYNNNNEGDTGTGINSPRD